MFFIGHLMNRVNVLQKMVRMVKFMTFHHNFKKRFKK